MKVEFEWDEQKNAANITKHGLDFSDAPRAFAAPMLTLLDGRFDYDEERWVGLGSIDGRAIVIVYTKLVDGTTRIISLRKALPYERKRYEQYLQDELG